MEKFHKTLTSNVLKLIAITAMFFDHFIAVFVCHDSLAGWLLRIPGRIVAPIMCYLVAEGFVHTRNIHKYLLRMFIFAVISHIPFIVCFDLPFFNATSVIWSLFLGLLGLTIVKNTLIPTTAKILTVAGCCLLAYPADWNYIGVLWVMFFGFFYGDLKKQMISFSLIGLVLFLPRTLCTYGWMHAYQFGIFIAIPLLYLYNGERGKNTKFTKWAFYWFYPMHLIVLCFLHYLLEA